MATQHVLYLGMGGDIMAPLLLVPDLTTLFVLDIFDDCFSTDGTEAGQRADIRGVLTRGTDELTRGSWCYAIDKRQTFSLKRWLSGEKRPAGKASIVHRLPARAVILSETLDEKACIWRLTFSYNGQERKLVSFYDHDFLTQRWPAEVRDVCAVMVMGAFAWCDVRRYTDRRLITDMLATRTLPTFTYYASEFLHEDFPQRVRIQCGSEREGTDISFVTVAKQFNSTAWTALLNGCK